jgi:hypothetical protein
MVRLPEVVGGVFVGAGVVIMFVDAGLLSLPWIFGALFEVAGLVLFFLIELPSVPTRPIGQTRPRADAERYAVLLSNLENLRTRHNLPETVYNRLQEEYVERLRGTLEDVG